MWHCGTPEDRRVVFRETTVVCPRLPPSAWKRHPNKRPGREGTRCTSSCSQSTPEMCYRRARDTDPCSRHSTDGLVIVSSVVVLAEDMFSVCNQRFLSFLIIVHVCVMHQYRYRYKSYITERYNVIYKTQYACSKFCQFFLGLLGLRDYFLP